MLHRPASMMAPVVAMGTSIAVEGETPLLRWIAQANQQLIAVSIALTGGLSQRSAAAHRRSRKRIETLRSPFEQRVIVRAGRRTGGVQAGAYQPLMVVNTEN